MTRGELMFAANALPVFARPSATAIYLLAAIACLAAVTLLFTYARARTKRSTARAARFATQGDLKPLHVARAEPGRVTLGIHHRKLVAAERRSSALVVGPSQSGKTTGLVVPAILEWEGPVLATSVKSDVVHDTHAARTRRGEVKVFDPTGSTKLPSAAWSPIGASRTWESARRTAARLLSIGEHSGARSADEAFWRPAGARYLAPLLLAAAQGELTMSDVLRWIATIEEREPATLLDASRDLGASAALDGLQSVWESDPRFRSSLLQTVATALDPWQEPSIANATMGNSDITPSWLLDGENTLYLVAPADDQRRLRGMFCALIADVTAAAFKRATEKGAPIDPPLLVALDEAANIAPLPNLDEIASTGPGQGVQLLTVLQNLSQAADRWGRDRAETLMANHRARVFCSGIADRATLDYLKTTLGEQEITRRSINRHSALVPGTRTTSKDFRALATPDRVRQTDQDKALLIYGRLPPAWLKLRPWYQDRRLKSLVTAGVTQ
jgi:type IV secretion system protein VirD4